jgi:hypothetical protein
MRASPGRIWKDCATLPVPGGLHQFSRVAGITAHKHNMVVIFTDMNRRHATRMCVTSHIPKVLARSTCGFRSAKDTRIWTRVCVMHVQSRVRKSIARVVQTWYRALLVCPPLLLGFSTGTLFMGEGPVLSMTGRAAEFGRTRAHSAPPPLFQYKHPDHGAETDTEREGERETHRERQRRQRSHIIFSQLGLRYKVTSDASLRTLLRLPSYTFT